MLRFPLRRDETVLLKGSKLIVTDQRVKTVSSKFSVDAVTGQPRIEEAWIASSLNSASGFIGLFCFFGTAFTLTSDMVSHTLGYANFIIALALFIMAIGAFNTAGNNRFRERGYKIFIQIKDTPSQPFSSHAALILETPHLGDAKLAYLAITEAIRLNTKSPEIRPSQETNDDTNTAP